MVRKIIEHNASSCCDGARFKDFKGEARSMMLTRRFHRSESKAEKIANATSLSPVSTIIGVVTSVQVRLFNALAPHRTWKTRCLSLDFLMIVTTAKEDIALLHGHPSLHRSNTIVIASWMKKVLVLYM
jgi:hypothetical protein